MLHHDEIKDTAYGIGFDLCGVARARTFLKNAEAFDLWLDRGYDSSLEYMRRNCDKRMDVKQLVEGAQTIVVCL